MGSPFVLRGRRSDRGKGKLTVVENGGSETRGLRHLPALSGMKDMESVGVMVGVWSNGAAT
jgi:hypothetical protein